MTEVITIGADFAKNIIIIRNRDMLSRHFVECRLLAISLS